MRFWPAEALDYGTLYGGVLYNGTLTTRAAVIRVFFDNYRTVSAERAFLLTPAKFGGEIVTILFRCFARGF